MADRKNGGAAGPPLFGEAAPRLRALGYKPTPWPPVEGPRALASELRAAVNWLGLLILAPIEDPKLGERVRAELDTRGLLAGPVRVGSDGTQVRPLRHMKLWQPIYTALDEAVVLQESGLVSLDAEWPAGTLLEVHRDELPQIDADVAIKLFEELQGLRTALAAERRPPPQPSRKGWIR